ncbi:MAG: hypothetical protein GX982_07070, partial [Tissierellia bacterium]|nr:hypothetical protein [Tissierellia bacterium]
FPLASIGITVSLLVLLMGGATGSKELKKIGGGGIVTVFTVTIFYYLYPLLLGLFGSAANVL